MCTVHYTFPLTFFFFKSGLSSLLMWIYKTKLGTSWIIGKSVDKYYQARGKKKKNRDAEDSAEKCIGLVIAKKKKYEEG